MSVICGTTQVARLTEVKLCLVTVGMASSQVPSRSLAWGCRRLGFVAGFYAISDSGRYWAGPYQMDVTVEAFTQCYDIGVETSDPDLNRSIGFRGFVMDDDYDDFTVNLVY